MKLKESVIFINGQGYTLEYKSANMSVIMKELDKKSNDGHIGIKKTELPRNYSFSELELKQTHIKSLLDEPMIKIFLNHKSYFDMTDSDKDNWIFFDNGKTSIEILAAYRDCFPCKYEFNEYYENENIVSKGCFPVKSSGISYLDFGYEDRNRLYYFENPNYKGSEYFRQAFLYNNKLATISLVVKKVAEYPGWLSTYPEFSVSIVVGYYELDNNQSLKGLTSDAIIEYTSLVGDFLSVKTIPNSTDIIPVVTGVNGGNAHWDSSFFSSRIEEFQKPIQKGLSKAYRKVEHYLGTKLESKEKLGFAKKLIRSRKTGEIKK